MREYEELRVRIWRIADDRFVVSASGTECAAQVVSPPRERSPRALRCALTDTLKYALAGQTRPSDKLRRLGRDIYRAYLDGPVAECLDRRHDEIKTRGENAGLRIRYHASASTMSLPLEAFYASSEDHKQALALRREISLTRSLRGGGSHDLRRLAAEDEAEPLDVLAVVSGAAPRGHNPVEADAELAAIREAIPPVLRRYKPLRYLGWAPPGTLRERATVKNLRSALGKLERAAAVVVVAHGTLDRNDDIELVLEREDGSPDYVSPDLLRELLGRPPGLRLVVLNICLGAVNEPDEPYSGLAQALIAEGIPAVVAMQTSVTNRAGGLFSPALFERLWRNATIDEAVWSGRMAMTRAETRVEWATPVLYLHESCAHGWLYKVAADRTGDGEDPLVTARATFQRTDEPGAGPAALVDAARLARRHGDWGRVRNYSDRAREAMQQGDVDESLERAVESLRRECESEDAAAACERVCELIGEGDFETAGDELDSRDRAEQFIVPDDLRTILRAEIELAKTYVAAREKADKREATAREKANKKEVILLWGQVVHTYRTYELLARDSGAPGFLEYRDVAARLAYAEGRQRELAGEWSQAKRCFAGVPGYFADVKARLEHVEARLAEAAQRWADALGLYEEILRRQRIDAPPDQRELRDAVACCRARLAERDENWDGMLEALDDVYGFLEGPRSRGVEVEHLRVYARSRIAELAARRSGDWSAVAEHLEALPEGFRNDADRLRHYAAARIAEERLRWRSAASSYGAANAYEDSVERSVYARARAEEDDGHWVTAAEAYDEIPTSSPDVAARAAWARGRAAEDEKRWKDAAAALESVAGDVYGDELAARRAFVAAREAEANGKWRGVIGAIKESAESIGSFDARYRCTPSLLAYARARLAEEEEDWDEATAWYARCDRYGDCGEREPYTRGRAREESGDWSLAIEAYRELAASRRRGEIERRLDRLTRLVEALPWIDGLASSVLVHDPFAERHGSPAYAALAAAGITASSSMDEVKDASFALMEKDCFGAEARAALDRLSRPEQRLEVDAFLLELAEPEKLRSAMRRLEPGPARRLVRELIDSVPRDAGLLELLAGRREDAVRIWEERLQNDTGDLAAAKSLAISCFWHARELVARGASEHAGIIFRTAIGYWTLVLSDEAYWDRWREGRTRCYGLDVTRPQTKRLRGEIGLRFKDALQRCADADPRHLGDLPVLLEVELEGARTLDEVGGLRLREDAPRIVCGPVHVHEAGLTRDFARLVARLDRHASAEEPDTILTVLDAALDTGDSLEGGRHETLRRLRAAYSSLGRASVHLANGRPRQALNTLPAVVERNLADLEEDCAVGKLEGEQLDDHLETCSSCQEFIATDGAFLFLPHRSARLLRDAVVLATRAHLDIAREALTTSASGLETALSHWSNALSVARRGGIQVRVKRAILRVILGRAEALASEMAESRGDRLTEAMALIENAGRLIGSANDADVRAKHAEILTARGIWHGFACHEFGIDPDPGKAVDDLRRALELNPESLDTRECLSRVLVCWGAGLVVEGSSTRALKLITEALGHLHDGLRRHGRNRQLRELFLLGLEHAEESLLDGLSDEQILARMDDGANANRDAESGTLMDFIEKARRNPHADNVRRELLEALEREPGDRGPRRGPESA